MARDAAVMTAGPARKRTPMEMPVARHPHAMRFGCSAINNPGHETSAALVSSIGPGAASACVGAGLIGGAGLRDDRSTRGVGARSRHVGECTHPG